MFETRAWDILTVASPIRAIFGSQLALGSTSAAHQENNERLYIKTSHKGNHVY